MCEVSHMLHTLQTLLDMNADISVTAYLANAEKIAGTGGASVGQRAHLQLHSAHQG